MPSNSVNLSEYIQNVCMVSGMTSSFLSNLISELKSAYYFPTRAGVQCRRVKMGDKKVVVVPKQAEPQPVFLFAYM